LALTINRNKLVFNKEVKGGSGILLGVDIFPISNDKLVEHTTAIISHERLHEQLGHPHQAIVTETAKKYGCNIKPTIDTTCASCAKGKTKRKKIAKDAKNIATMKGGRIFMDISSINVKSKGGNKFWLLLQDELTSCLWSFFMKHKSDLTMLSETYMTNQGHFGQKQKPKMSILVRGSDRFCTWFIKYCSRRIEHTKLRWHTSSGNPNGYYPLVRTRRHQPN
jgi:hypothetical protein